MTLCHVVRILPASRVERVSCHNHTPEPMESVKILYHVFWNQYLKSERLRYHMIVFPSKPKIFRLASWGTWSRGVDQMLHKQLRARPCIIQIQPIWVAMHSPHPAPPQNIPHRSSTYIITDEPISTHHHHSTEFILWADFYLAALGLRCSMQTVRCGMQDRFLTRDKSWAPALTAWSLQPLDHQGSPRVHSWCGMFYGFRQRYSSQDPWLQYHTE